MSLLQTLKILSSEGSGEGFSKRHLNLETYSETAKKNKQELSGKAVSGCKPLTIFTKNSILGVLS